MNNYFKLDFDTMKEASSIFNSDKEATATPTVQEIFASVSQSGNCRSSVGQGSVFSPLAPPFQSRINTDLASMEPQIGDIAPFSLDFDQMNLGNTESGFVEDKTGQNTHFPMGPKAETAGNTWSDGSTSNYNKKEMLDMFEFLIKTLTSANTYASLLTREQTTLLQGIRPSLLYDFLQEIVRVRSEKRMQRALGHECAFCKNNGENEDKYSSHALKDYKGRVQCPVLRAFHCPRCGATGDRAHTIKYCPMTDNLMDRHGNYMQRRMSVNSFQSFQSNDQNFQISDQNFRGSYGTPSTPVQSPTVSSVNLSSFWSNN